MAWSKEDIHNHIECSKILGRIKDDAFEFISKNNNVTEYDVQKFILDSFKKYHLKTTQKPIVAFNSSASDMHYMPVKNSRRIEKNTLIMIDIWAAPKDGRKPYSDMTWMAYTGKLSSEMKKVCDIVFSARDACIKYLRKELSSGRIPTGKELDAVTRTFLDSKGYGKYFIHSTGHSIGFNSPHGIYGALRRTNDKPLMLNMGYTIEPGIYLKGKFGARSEIDFYITSDKKLVITTGVQKEIVKLG